MGRTQGASWTLWYIIMIYTTVLLEKASRGR